MAAFRGCSCHFRYFVPSVHSVLSEGYEDQEMHVCAYVYLSISQRLYEVVKLKEIRTGNLMKNTKERRKKGLMAAETPFVTNGLFNLKYLIGFRAL